MKSKIISSGALPKPGTSRFLSPHFSHRRAQISQQIYFTPIFNQTRSAVPASEGSQVLNRRSPNASARTQHRTRPRVLRAERYVHLTGRQGGRPPFVLSDFRLNGRDTLRTCPGEQTDRQTATRLPPGLTGLRGRARPCRKAPIARSPPRATGHGDEGPSAPRTARSVARAAEGEAPLTGSRSRRGRNPAACRRGPAAHRPRRRAARPPPAAAPARARR